MPGAGELARLGDVERLQRILDRAWTRSAIGGQGDEGGELRLVGVGEPLDEHRIRTTGGEIRTRLSRPERKPLVEANADAVLGAQDLEPDVIARGVVPGVGDER